MNVKLKFVELDVLKSQEPGIEKYARKLNSLENIETVSITVIEVDARTETLQISIKGKDINLSAVKQQIKSLGGTVHSVDKVISSGKNSSNTSFLPGE
ncbi:MAG: DUF211 domain-containing protein [Elusimicrobiota bacterium]